MRLVDTHCHLDFPDYKNDMDEVLKRATEAGVERVIVPGTSISSSLGAIKLAEKYPQVFTACGIHPHEADKASSEDVEKLRQMAITSGKVVAIGEVGLDYYKGYSDPRNQRKLFSECIALARELDFPVIMHCRNAEEDILKLLKCSQFNTTEGVIHCFSGGKDFLEEILSMGFYVSFAGNITFKKSGEVRNIIKNVPLDRLLLETDSPYITPEPFRGRRNEPGYVKYLLDAYRKIYDMPRDEIAAITTHNADKLFRLGLDGKDTVSYKIRNSLYINVTHRCTNRCYFCTRDISDYVKGYNLKLDKEPSYEEIIDSIGGAAKYDEVVFCGLGEPTLRLDIIKRVAKYVKDTGGVVRLTTNGEANLINGKSVPPELKGLVDRVSVSLNAPDASTYDHICRSVFGEKAFEASLAFIRECGTLGIEVEITCLDILKEKDIGRCRKIAAEHGAKFRLRHLNVVG